MTNWPTPRDGAWSDAAPVTTGRLTLRNLPRSLASVRPTRSALRRTTSWLSTIAGVTNLGVSTVQKVSTGATLCCSKFARSSAVLALGASWDITNLLHWPAGCWRSGQSKRKWASPYRQCEKRKRWITGRRATHKLLTRTGAIRERAWKCWHGSALA